MILSMITIDKSSPEPLHLQLSKKLKNIIVKHRLEAGYALPSERQLSEKFELNRNTVHRAYETLKDNGLLVSRAGSRGIFISEDAKDLYHPAFPCIGILLTCNLSDFILKGSKMGLNYLSGVVDRASELNYSTMIVNLPAIGSTEEKVLEWRDNLVSRLTGVIYFGDRGIKNDFAFDSLARYTNLPQVFVSAHSQYDNVSTVNADVRTGAQEAAELLYKNGHRRVGMILPDLGTKREWGFVNASFERQSIMKNCFEKCGIEVHPAWIAQKCCDLQSMASQLDRILNFHNTPTAFWCQNDFTALCALNYFKLRHIKIPDDISLFGFDDIEETAQSDPPLTSIQTNNYFIGRNAADLVVDLFENGRVGEQREILVPTSLSHRQSINKAKKELVEV
ncbi:MAG: substrate-binding domain-containing protein [Victivallaceae bacterium]|nr:substrate-binding domain-containing protein [Victivallaceae bacterium]